jgi:hypothetical protein
VDKTAAMFTDTTHPRMLQAAEGALQVAMVTGDADRLDELVHPRATFSDPDGQLVIRDAYLARYRQGVLVIRAFDEVDRQVRVEGSTGITLVLADLSGSCDGHSLAARLRFSRTWVHDGGRWQVLNAHGSRVPAAESRPRTEAGFDPESGPGEDEPLDGDGEAFVLI